MNKKSVNGQPTFEAGNDAKQLIPPPFLPFGEAELANARLHPRCIVKNHLYADLGLMAGAGGTGKTTTQIYEAVCVAIKRPLWGCEVISPGATLFVTAEDSRDLFAARLREVLAAMNLTKNERRLALECIAVWDVSGETARLAQLDRNGNIEMTPLADSIISAHRDAGLAQVVFDPAISFGPGERIINDGEQAIVTACRRIIRGLDCCVRLNHHTGKANARASAIDQYASRGGTALPDGCRMVTILSSVNGENHGTPPEGFSLAPGDSGFIMARAKLSYAPPQPNIWIRRRGFAFDYFVEERRGADETLTRDADRIAEFIADELTHGRKYTPNTLEQSRKIKLSRTRLRSALANLEVSGRLVEHDLPTKERHGKRKTYLHPLDQSAAHIGGIDPKIDVPASTSNPIPPAVSNPPSYRETRNGGLDAVPCISPSLNPLKHDGGLTADWRISDEGTQTEPLAIHIAELEAAGWSPWNARAKALDETQPVSKMGRVGEEAHA